MNAKNVHRYFESLFTFMMSQKNIEGFFQSHFRGAIP